MNIIFLTNNKNTKPLIFWLLERNDVYVISGKLKKYDIKKIKPDWIISFNYKHKIAKSIIDLMPERCINLHISFLPFNGGCAPNLWSFINDTMKGITIHYVSPDIDSGRIIMQREIVFPNEQITLRTSYFILIDAMMEMFKYWWANKYHDKKETDELIAKLPENYLDIPVREIKKIVYKSDNI